MNEFALFLAQAWNVMNTPFQLFGYTISFFQIFAYTEVAGILLYIVWRVFDG